MTQDGSTQALYRFYDATGTLLYIGITADPGARWRSHARDKVWWHEVAQITLEPHDTRQAVEAAEQAAIHTEAPAYNVTYNRRDLPLQPHRPTPAERAPAPVRDFLDHVTKITGLGLASTWGLVARGKYAEAEARGRDILNSYMALQQPDDCHDTCVPLDRLGIYFPYRWTSDGCAHYQCAAGHHWTCWWGHTENGEAPEWRGRPYQDLRR